MATVVSLSFIHVSHLSMYPTFVVYSRCCVPLQYWVGRICWLTSLSQLSHHKSIWSCPVLDDRFHWLTFSRDGCLEGWVCLNSQFPDLDSHFLFITWPIYQSIHVFSMNIKSTNQTSSTHKKKHKSPTKLSNLTLSKYLISECFTKLKPSLFPAGEAGRRQSAALTNHRSFHGRFGADFMGLPCEYH